MPRHKARTVSASEAWGATKFGSIPLEMVCVHKDRGVARIHFQFWSTRNRLRAKVQEMVLWQECGGTSLAGWAYNSNYDAIEVFSAGHVGLFEFLKSWSRRLMP